jgi:hypothetical protein
MYDELLEMVEHEVLGWRPIWAIFGVARELLAVANLRELTSWHKVKKDRRKVSGGLTERPPLTLCVLLLRKCRFAS